MVFKHGQDRNPFCQKKIPGQFIGSMRGLTGPVCPMWPGKGGPPARSAQLGAGQLPGGVGVGAGHRAPSLACARVMAQVDRHPNILRIYGMCQRSNGEPRPLAPAGHKRRVSGGMQLCSFKEEFKRSASLWFCFSFQDCLVPPAFPCKEQYTLVKTFPRHS